MGNQYIRAALMPVTDKDFAAARLDEYVGKLWAFEDSGSHESFESIGHDVLEGGRDES